MKTRPTPATSTASTIGESPKGDSSTKSIAELQRENALLKAALLRWRQRRMDALYEIDITRTGMAGHRRALLDLVNDCLSVIQALLEKRALDNLSQECRFQLATRIGSLYGSLDRYVAVATDWDQQHYKPIRSVIVDELAEDYHPRAIPQENEWLEELYQTDNKFGEPATGGDNDH